MRSLGHVLVVGGAGFVGGWIVECLVDPSIATTVLDRSAGSKDTFGGVEVIADDVSRVDVQGVVDERDIDAVFHLLRRAIAGEDPLVVLGSPVICDFVFVADCVRAMLVLARRTPARGEAYNIASGIGTRLGALVPLLLEAGGLETSVEFIGTLRPGDPVRWGGDPSAARALGAVIDTSLVDGPQQTAEWLLARTGAHTATQPGAP
jgi:nucleoside-diphosphate-sugar epimerase